MKKILIIGATSAIAQAFARICAQKGGQLFLVARNPEKLQVLAADLKVRGATVAGILAVDANALDQHEAIVSAATENLKGLDTVLIAHGSLPDQKKAERDFKIAGQEYKTNFLSVVSMLTPIADFFEKQQHGVIAVISSVAGDRGRQSNYIYGSAKAGLSVYLDGLRNRLYHNGVAVVTIKPGFVDTPMTAHLKKGFLFASPEKVAQDIFRAVDKKKCVVYTPWFWRWIMFIIKSIPETIFRRLKL
jgi:decaprenylphospho-beta-D-erythro-pentofuranosid-2-ulose 2-reductase